MLSDCLNTSRYRAISATALVRLIIFLKRFCFNCFFVKFSIERRFLNNIVEKIHDDEVIKTYPETV